MPKKTTAKKAQPPKVVKAAATRKNKPPTAARPTSVSLAVVAKWVGSKQADVLGFGAETGLPIGNVTDLAKLFKSLFGMRDRLKPAADASYTTAEGLICTTYEAAAQALRARLGIGCAKSVQNWISQGMPGTPGQGVSRRGYFPIDAMEAWARANLTLDAKKLDEAAMLRRARLEDERIRNMTLKNEREEKKNKVIDGELLQRAVYTAFVTECLATLSISVMSLPMVLLRAGHISKERRAEFQTDCEAALRQYLDDLSTALEKGPDADA